MAVVDENSIQLLGYDYIGDDFDSPTTQLSNVSSASPNSRMDVWVVDENSFDGALLWALQRKVASDPNSSVRRNMCAPKIF